LQTTTTNYKLIKKVKDDRFDDEQLQDQTLIIQSGAKDFQIAVVDGNSQLMLLEDYAMGNVQSHSELYEALKDLFDSHALLQAGFWKEVRIGIKNSKCCLMPTSLFDERLAANYLKLNATVDLNRETVLHCHDPKNDSTTVFALQNDFYQWLTKIYQRTSFSFYHQSSAIIEGVLTNSQTTHNTLFAFIDRFKLHIITADAGKLVYYNQFPINQFQDYIKYIMTVLKGLNMDQKNSEIVLWGYIGKNSPHYQEFIKYIRNVSFGKRPHQIRFGYLFDEVQEHHFFDLLSMYLLK